MTDPLSPPPTLDELAFAYLNANIDDDSPLLAWEIRQEMHKRVGLEKTLEYIQNAVEVREMCGVPGVID